MTKSRIITEEAGARYRVERTLSDARLRFMARAFHQYGDNLRCEVRRRTECTLQGMVETGFCVWGRAHGGDFLACLFPTRAEAESAILDAQYEYTAY